MQSVTRLIRTFVPEHYDLSVNLNRLKRTFEGTVSITGVSTDIAKDIRLHAKDLTIHSATFDGKAADFKLTQNDELVITHPDLVAGQHIVVVNFSGIITDTMNGIYPCYYEFEGQKRELIATQFESHYARQAFPCVDEPEAKATFNVTLTTELGVTVLGNMPVTSQREENELLVTRFETTPRMSSYLLAWVVGDLQKTSATTKSGVEVNIWATKAHPANNLDFALDIATRTIDFFDEYFGVPYPLPKSDHVALPDFSSGAMENWGLITYREIALLVDPTSTSLDAKHYAALVIAHELSHQWFGNLVTMQWWNDLWLNESFATMMEYVAIDNLEPSWNVWLDHASSDVLSALRRDSLDGVQAIRSEVNHPDEISTMFDPSIVYAKGSRLLRMLQAYLGDDALQAGLKKYFHTHKYQNTVAEDLWNSLGAASDKDIAGFMSAWMNQSGYPVVHVHKEDSTISLSQEQFFIGPHEDSTALWPIPLHGLTEEIPELLDEQAASFTYTSNKPFLLNSNGSAHFITHYDKELLDEILKNVQDLSPIDRLQLLHEQTLLAQAGIIATAELIPLLKQYADETDESVWSLMSVAINELKKFTETDEMAEKKLRAFVGTLTASQYERLGWESADNEPENDTKLRSTIIGLVLYSENQEAVAHAQQLYANTKINELDAELRTAILANAVRQAKDESVVDALLEEYKNATLSELRDDITGALTATKKLSDIERLSKLLKDATIIRPQDFTHWFVWLSRNRYGRTFMWQWARNEWDWIEKTFASDSHYEMFPRYIASSLVSADQLNEYREFFNPLLKVVALKRNITIGMTELEGKVALIERDGPAVRAALLEL